MPALAIGNIIRTESAPECVSRVLEEVCTAAKFGRNSEERREVAALLESLYADGYFTVEGLRQALIAHVARATSSFPLRYSRGNST
jgi:hypothetical protein